MLRTISLVALSLLHIPSAYADDYRLTILHTNDVHARMEPTKIKQGTYGGYPRQVALARRFFQSDTNPILLSAGDVFQGTLYFNVYEGLADAAMMNLMRYTALGLGNHEFDRGPATLARFIRSTQFPILSANLDVSNEPELKDLVKPSTVIEVGGEKIGLIGAITPDLLSISSPGPNIKMLDWLKSVQAEADRLAAKGINKVIVVSHSGYEFEVDMAKKLKGVDVIVGGHSHTLLGDNICVDFPKGRGEYPTEVTAADGNKALVVQAWDWGKVFGRIMVDFDKSGKILRWERGLVAVDSTIADDPEAAAILAAFKKPIEAMASVVVGRAETEIGRGFGGPMGGIIADAQMLACMKWKPELALMNAGGIRSAIDEGPITYGEAVQVQPFSNSLVVLDLTGEELRNAFEWGVREMPGGSAGMLYVSKEVQYEIDPSAPVGNRISVLKISGKDAIPSKTYRVVLNSFLAGGGDGHEAIKNAKGHREDTGLMDIDAFVDFLKANQPLGVSSQKRISVKK